MTVNKLIEQLKLLNPDTEVVVEHRVKTDIDEGDIYLSNDILVCLSAGKVMLVSLGVTRTGGW